MSRQTEKERKRKNRELVPQFEIELLYCGLGDLVATLVLLGATIGYYES